MNSDKLAERGDQKGSGNGSCLRAGIPESDTGESGEESEPTYRHYDNFETDVCLTQDEDEDLTDQAAGVVKDLGQKLNPYADEKGKPRMTTPGGAEVMNKENSLSVLNPVNRGLSSDSDSCTESEITQGQGQVTDDTTTSTSESEETQIWVPVSMRPSTRQMQDSTTDLPPSGTSSNGSDRSRPQSYIHKAGSPPPASVGSLSYVSSAAGLAKTERNNSRAGSHDGVRRNSRDSWHTVQSNVQSSGVNKRVSPSKQVSLGLLRHDEATGTITLDIRNVPNGDPGLEQGDGQYTLGAEDTINLGGGVNVSLLTSRSTQHTRSTLARLSFGESLCVICSGLYMLFVVVTGLVLPVAEVFIDQPYPALFEGFYIYLFVASVAFLVYAYSYLLRIKTTSAKRGGRTIVSSVPVPTRKRNSSADGATDTQTGSFYLRLGAVGLLLTKIVSDKIGRPCSEWNIDVHF